MFETTNQFLYQLSTSYQPVINQLSTSYQPVINQLSTSSNNPIPWLIPTIGPNFFAETQRVLTAIPWLSG